MSKVEDKGRNAVASEAAGQIESLVRMLGREVVNEEDSEAFERTLLSSLKRIHQLNSVVLSVLDGDDLRTTENMKQVVYL